MTPNSQIFQIVLYWGLSLAVLPHQNLQGPHFLIGPVVVRFFVIVPRPHLSTIYLSFFILIAFIAYLLIFHVHREVNICINIIDYLAPLWALLLNWEMVINTDFNLIVCLKHQNGSKKSQKYRNKRLRTFPWCSSEHTCWLQWGQCHLRNQGSRGAKLLKHIINPWFVIL